ncbi:hypothetical protein Q3G72_015780 [Acer saccharum]|nr:hypothetical protein Q3G72_015780 [Acer saccharum]
MAQGRTSRGRGKGKNAKVVEEVDSMLSVGRSGEEVIASMDSVVGRIGEEVIAFVDGVDVLEEEIEEMVDEEIVAEIGDSLGVQSCGTNAEVGELGFLSSANPKPNLVDDGLTGGNTQVVVEPLYEVIEEGISKWSSSLVGQFLYKPLSYYHVKKVVDILWKQFGKVEVFLLDNCMYIFQFADEATIDEVLSAPLWHFSNKSLILRRWEPGLQILKLSLNSIPIWIKLMHLPMEFWIPTCLSYVVSGVGKPLYADSITRDQTRLGFARVLVEVHSDSTFPKEVVIKGAGGQLVFVGVEYPWIPIQCNEWKEISAPQTWKHKEGDMGESIFSQGIPGKQIPVNHTNTKAWSNSFEALHNKKDVEFKEGEIQSNRVAINAIQKIIEDALSKEHSKLKLRSLKGRGKWMRRMIIRVDFLEAGISDHSPYVVTVECVVKKEGFGYHHHCSKVGLTHLCFTDDLLIFLAVSVRFVSAVQKVHSEFESLSGLKANPDKSTCFCVGVSPLIQSHILSTLKMGEGKLPVRYLGVPLISFRLCAADCDTLLEKITHPDGVIYEKYGHRVIYDAHSKLKARLESIIQNGQWYWHAAHSDHIVNIQSRLYGSY